MAHRNSQSAHLLSAGSYDATADYYQSLIDHPRNIVDILLKTYYIYQRDLNRGYANNERAAANQGGVLAAQD